LLGLAVLVLGAGSAFLFLFKRSSPPPIEPTEQPWFVDVTDEWGINFTHDVGPVGTYFMPQQVGSGAALFDCDGDGRLDIYLLQNGGPAGPKNVLYKQLPDGKFRDASAGSGLYDGLKFFLNNGDGTFSDATQEAALSNPAWGTSAALFDYDRDGWLDLVVVSYVDYDATWVCTGPSGARDYCAPKTFKGRVSRLFHNEGARLAAGKANKAPRVLFRDVTESSGLSRVPGPGLGVVCADFDGDGWPDIFIANDGEANRLWINGKNGTFKEEAVQRGIAYNAMGKAEAGMGVALGDIDGDGLFDVFVTHLAEETHTFWKQGPRGLFRDTTAQTGVVTPTTRGTGFGTVLTDFDHDGVLDLAIVNGRVAARTTVKDNSLGPFWSAYGDNNQIFRGKSGARFTDLSPHNAAFSGRVTVSRGLVRGDIDGDGAQDLVVTSIAGRARVFRNVAPKRGHWLSVRAHDPALNRDVYGAEIRARVGEKSWTAWLNPAESYLCSGEPCAHFGFGDVKQLDGIDVLWPDGTRETFPGGETDRRRVLTRGSGSVQKK
jgi:hypothetical protein